MKNGISSPDGEPELWQEVNEISGTGFGSTGAVIRYSFASATMHQGTLQLTKKISTGQVLIGVWDREGDIGNGEKEMKKVKSIYYAGNGAYVIRTDSYLFVWNAGTAQTIDPFLSPALRLELARAAEQATAQARAITPHTPSNPLEEEPEYLTPITEPESARELTRIPWVTMEMHCDVLAIKRSTKCKIWREQVQISTIARDKPLTIVTGEGSNDWQSMIVERIEEKTDGTFWVFTKDRIFVLRRPQSNREKALSSQMKQSENPPRVSGHQQATANKLKDTVRMPTQNGSQPQ